MPAAAFRDLQNNYITAIQGLQQLPSLEKLYLEGNGLAGLKISRAWRACASCTSPASSCRRGRLWSWIPAA